MLPDPRDRPAHPPWRNDLTLLPTATSPASPVAPWPLQSAYTLRRFILETNGTYWAKGLPSPHWEIAPTPFAALALAERFNVEGQDDRFRRLLDCARRSIEERPTPSPSDPDEIPLLATPLPGIDAPWAHQRAATAWLDRRLSAPGSGALLYLGMGTGKTRATLDWLVARHIKRTVIVVPKGALGVWAEEAERWWPGHFRIWTMAPTHTVVRRWSDLLESKTLESPKPQLIVANYDSIWRDPFDQILKQDYGVECVIADECHKLKGRSSERSRYFRTLWKTIPYRIALTGTPLSNGMLTDAYGQFAFLDPGIFGLSIQRFEDRYAIKRNWQVLGWRNTEDFYKRFWWVTRHEDRSVLDLPPCVEVIREIQLPTDARRLYNSMKEDAFVELRDKIVTAQNAVVILAKLQQIASGRLLTGDASQGTRAALPIHDEKQSALLEVLKETGTEPVVVFCLFREDLRQVHAAAKDAGLTSLELSGSRHELDEWKRGDATVLAVQIQSGSEGISLVRAQVGVFFSPSHSLAHMEQAKARLHRPGQRSSVTLIHLLAQATVDTQMHRAHIKKVDFVKALIDSKGEALHDDA